MYRVTERRMEKVRHILDDFSQQLEDNGKFRTEELEKQLKDTWSTGYQSIKDAMIDLYKNHGGRYGRVAEYYMRNQAPANMMVSEFKVALGVR